MNERKCFTLEEAASVLSISEEELLSRSREVFGSEKPKKFKYEDLENLILKSRIRIKVNSEGRNHAFEFLRKESLDGEDIYFVLIQEEGSGEDIAHFLEVRVEKELAGIIELIGILKNLLIEKEINGPSLVSLNRDCITVSELFSEFEV